MNEQNHINRIDELELMKFVALIGMIFVHVLEASWYSMTNVDAGAGLGAKLVIEFFGGVMSCGVFAFAMGWGAYYNRARKPVDYVKRFLKLTSLGVLVNFFQYCIPSVLDPEGQGYFSDNPWMLITVDFYFFAAISMLILGLLKKVRGRASSVIAVVLIVAALIINNSACRAGLSTGNGWIDTLIGLFFRVNDYSYYPLITWVPYPLFGYLTAISYDRFSKKDRRGTFVGGVFLSGIVIFAISQFFIIKGGLPQNAINPGGYGEDSFYAMDSFNVICGLSLVLMGFVIAFFIVKLLGGRLPSFIKRLSRRIMVLYVFQWAVIGYITPWLATIDNVLINVLVGIAVTLLSCWFTYISDTEILHGIFDSSVRNSGRQVELDFAKAFPILNLAVVHMICECSTDAQLNVFGVPYFFDSIIGGPLGAPLFIFAMGMVVNYARSSEPWHIFKRGLCLGLFGFIHNICRFVIPGLIGYGMTGDYEFYMERIPYLLFSCDILQFACVGMMLMALFKKLRMNCFHILIAGMVMSMIGTLIGSVDLGSPVLNIIFGFFIGTEDPAGLVVSDFPVMNWFFMYAAGNVTGQYYRNIKDKKRLFLLVSPVCGVILLIGSLIEWEMGYAMMGGEGANVFYHLNTIDAFLCICGHAAMLGIWYLVSGLHLKKIQAFVGNISRNITRIYVIQWVLVWWFADLILIVINGTKYIPTISATLWGIVLELASILLANLWGNYQNKRKNRGGAS